MLNTGFLPSQYASNTCSSSLRLVSIISYIQMRCFGVGFMVEFSRAAIERTPIPGAT